MPPTPLTPPTPGLAERLEQLFELSMAVSVGLASPLAGLVALLALGSVDMDVVEVGERLVRWSDAGAGGQQGHGISSVVFLAPVEQETTAADPTTPEPVAKVEEDATEASEPGASAEGPASLEPGPIEQGGGLEVASPAVASDDPVGLPLFSEHPGEGVPSGTVKHGTGRRTGGGGGGGAGAPSAPSAVTPAVDVQAVAVAARPPVSHALDAAAGMSFVAIGGGGFWMGSPEDEPGRFANEGPRHRVHVSPFWLASTEVTRAQWLAVMGSLPPGTPGADRPVVGVSWCDAVRYANAMSQREGLTSVYRLRGPCGHGGVVSWDWRSDGYRLPTEAEWELAARAGGQQRFAGGSSLDGVGWYLDNAGGATRSVAALAPNAYGLYDMSGNVWEWVWDRLGDYGPEAQHDPVGPERGSTHILRGGSWRYEARYARVADRNWGRPGYRSPAVGFRLARSLQAGDQDALVSQTDGGPGQPGPRVSED